MNLPGPVGGRAARMATISALAADHAGQLDLPVAPAHVVHVGAGKVRADGAALSLTDTNGQPTSVSVIGELGATLDDLQLVLGEGPRVTTLHTGGPVLVPDLATSHVVGQWPAFAPAATSAGIRAHFALPLQFGAAQVGVLEFCRRNPGLLSSDELADANACADVALALVLDRQARIPDESTHGLADWITEPRARIHQAAGMVSAQLGVTVADALVRLRAHAYAQDLPLGEVANQVVSRRLRFTPDHPEPADTATDDGS